MLSVMMLKYVEGSTVLFLKVFCLSTIFLHTAVGTPFCHRWKQRTSQRFLTFVSSQNHRITEW